MEEIIPLFFGLICGWILLVGFGELWLRILYKSPLKKYFKKTDSENRKDRIIILCLCRAISVFPIVLLLWSLEHLQGLGKNISFLLPPLILGSLWVYYKNWQEASPLEKKTRLVLEVGFFLSILYVLRIFWNYSNLHIGDRSGDLCHTATMASGETLPPTHPWLPPYRAEDYYRGQWYAGGLLARLCNLTLAHNYFVSCILCVSWINSNILGCAWILTRQRVVAATIALAVIVLGGHFGSIVSPMTDKLNPHPLADGNLVGKILSSRENSRTDRLNELGLKFLNILETESKRVKPNAPVNEISCEAYAYSVHLGEWHSWFGGYLILSLVVVAIAAYAKSQGPPTTALACATLGVLIPSAFVFNTWIAPLTIICVGTTIAVGLLYKPKSIRCIGITMLGAIVAGSIVITPLSTLLHAKQYGDVAVLKLIATWENATFTPSLGWLIYAGAVTLWVALALWTTYNNIPVKKRISYLVAITLTIPLTTGGLGILAFILKSLDKGGTLHLGSPIVPSILIGLPVLALMLALYAKFKAIKLSQDYWVAVTATIIFSLLYSLVETVAVDDYLGPPFDRYNTSNKWLPSAMFVTTALCAPLALGAKKLSLKILPYLLALTLIISSFLSLWVGIDRRDGSDFSGASWIKETSAKPIYENLLKLEKGVVLEYQTKSLPYATPGGLMPLLTGHRAWIGWIVAHLGVWYPTFEILEKRREEAIQFYEGRLPNPSAWASENGIDYIVWSISLQDKYNGPGAWLSFTPPTTEEWDKNWEVNNKDLSKDYAWIETKPKPLIEGIWMSRKLLDSSRDIMKK